MSMIERLEKTIGPYTIQTWLEGSLIHQVQTCSIVKTQCKLILDTKEKQIREKLIELGWTPPKK